MSKEYVLAWFHFEGFGYTHKLELSSNERVIAAINHHARPKDGIDAKSVLCLVERTTAPPEGQEEEGEDE